MWPPSIPISAAILCSAAARRTSAAVVASIRSFGCALTALWTEAISALAVLTAFIPVTSDGTQIEKNSPSSPPSRIRGMSMLPFFWRLAMSKVLSDSSRCVVSSCESMTIARSCSCFARADTASAGARLREDEHRQRENGGDEGGDTHEYLSHARI